MTATMQLVTDLCARFGETKGHESSSVAGDAAQQNPSRPGGIPVQLHKNATIEAGAKVNHLSYVGDARVGAGANVGAGTITCNYDGVKKSHTDIGAGVFIGSNTALVAPVSIGDGAIVGAGSVITRDVDGNEIRLADLHRRVLVVEFWSAEGPGARTRVAGLQALVERHIDERFFLLGINLDADAERFRHLVESLEVQWTNVFEGGLAQRPMWRVDRPGANLVLDLNGVVRFVDVHGAELEAAVASLLVEMGTPAGPAQASHQALQGGGNPPTGSRGR